MDVSLQISYIFNKVPITPNNATYIRKQKTHAEWQYLHMKMITFFHFSFAAEPGFRNTKIDFGPRHDEVVSGSGPSNRYAIKLLLWYHMSQQNILKARTHRFVLYVFYCQTLQIDNANRVTCFVNLTRTQDDFSGSGGLNLFLDRKLIEIV